jgi:hypothetical protein
MMDNFEGILFFIIIKQNINQSFFFPQAKKVYEDYVVHIGKYYGVEEEWIRDVYFKRNNRFIGQVTQGDPNFDVNVQMDPFIIKAAQLPETRGGPPEPVSSSAAHEVTAQTGTTPATVNGSQPVSVTAVSGEPNPVIVTTVSGESFAGASSSSAGPSSSAGASDGTSSLPLMSSDCDKRKKKGELFQIFDDFNAQLLLTIIHFHFR